MIGHVLTPWGTAEHNGDNMTKRFEKAVGEIEKRHAKCQDPPVEFQEAGPGFVSATLPIEINPRVV